MTTTSIATILPPRAPVSLDLDGEADTLESAAPFGTEAPTGARASRRVHVEVCGAADEIDR